MTPPNLVAPLILFGDSVTLAVNLTGTYDSGIEGEIWFVRATNVAGSIVLEQPFIWPTSAYELRPGDYHVTVYMRFCDGNCDHLDPPAHICSVDIALVDRDAAIDYLVDAGCPVHYSGG